MLQFLPSAALGLLAGMLVNYLVDILPVKRSLAPPICTRCGERQELRAYFFWPRRCPHCGRPRGARVWLVELTYAALFAGLWGSEQAATFLPFWAAAMIWVFFGVVVVIDIELRLILHPVSAAGAALGLATGIALHGIPDTLSGGLAGYLVLLVLFWLGAVFSRITRRLQGDHEEVALGFGDVNLAGALGLLLGWPNILMGLMLSVMLAGLVSLGIVIGMVLLRRYRAFQVIPYGPFLIAGAALMLFLPESAQRLLAVIGPLFWIRP